MRAYYYIDTKRAERIYVPLNFDITMKDENIKVDFDPNKLKTEAEFISRNKISLERGLITIVDISDVHLREIRDLCFFGREKEAEDKARNIFLMISKRWKEICT